MNEVLGLILVVMGVTNATVTPNRIGWRVERFTGHGAGDEETAALRPIVPEAAAAWLLAAGLAVVPAGLASLAVAGCHAHRRGGCRPVTGGGNGRRRPPHDVRRDTPPPFLLRKRAPVTVGAPGGA
ncbi:hypothetical protein ABZ801_23580 [Actinomadura sp. NPDC047616]|uniref:hypothetical protein n=1 Tax=Actinomadura sp. NPDC047616 TaxID=3155914 RepID=UPI0033CE32A2